MRRTLLGGCAIAAMLAAGCVDDKKLYSDRDGVPKPLELPEAAPVATSGPADAAPTAPPTESAVPATPEFLASDALSAPKNGGGNLALESSGIGQLNIGPPQSKLDSSLSGMPAVGLPSDWLNRHFDQFGMLLEALEAAGRGAPGAEFDRIWREGLDFFQQQKLDQAMTRFQRLRVLNPQDYRGHLGEGAIYLQRQEFSRALAALNFAVGAAPDVSELYMHRGRAHTALGNLKAAADDYGRVLEKMPDNLECRFQRCVVNFHRRDGAAMMVDADALIRRGGDIPDAYLLRAIARVLLANGAYARRAPGEAKQHVALAQKDFDAAVKFGLAPQIAQNWRPTFYPESSN